MEPKSAADSFLETYHTFLIEPQALKSALDEFSKITGIQYQDGGVDFRGKASQGLSGHFSIMEGVTRLLIGSGVCHAWNSTTVVLKAAIFEAQAGIQLRKAWEKYFFVIEHTREITEKSASFQDPKDRAKGFHALIEAQAFAYNFAIAPRVNKPHVFQSTSWQTDIFTLGLNGPDGHYANIFLDGRLSYKLTGRLGKVDPFLLQVFTGIIGVPETKVIANYIVADEFMVEPDGRFEIVVSACKQSGNWLPLDSEGTYQWIMVRRYTTDANDDPGELDIEVMGRSNVEFCDREEFDEVEMARRIDRAADFLQFLVANWNVGIHDMMLSTAGGQTNKMAWTPGTSSGQVASPVSNYVHGIYEVSEDEALIVELPDPPMESPYWNFQLADVWGRSLDFLHHQSSLNVRQAVIDPDGVFRAVVCWRDPGVANWLDPVRHSRGVIIFRNFSTIRAPVPSLRRVHFDDVASLLPVGTRSITVEERQKIIKSRRRALLRRYGEG
jgi:hypothetical protein